MPLINVSALTASTRTECMIALAATAEGSAYGGEDDPEPAYKLANAKFSSVEYSGVFDPRRDMTDAIKDAIDEAALECPECEHMLSDD